MAAPRPPTGKPGFGLDAPGVIRNLLIVAAAGVLCGALGLTLQLVFFVNAPNPFRVILPLQYIGPCVAITFALTAAGMIWYSTIGKLRMRERLLDRVSWRGDERVLDVGCGRGLMLLGAAARLTTGRAVGIDLWQAADQTGNNPQATLANAQAAGVAERVEVHTGDARELPFPDANFDVVLSTAALHNIPDAAGRDRAVREIARVLKPSGRVVIADIQHLGRYAEVLRQNGLPNACAGHGWAYWPVLLITFSAVRAGTVTGQKVIAGTG